LGAVSSCPRTTRWWKIDGGETSSTAECAGVLVVNFQVYDAKHKHVLDISKERKTCHYRCLPRDQIIPQSVFPKTTRKV